MSFAEVTGTGLDYIFSSSRYAPWGIVFKKQHIFNNDGGPALYVRDGHEWRSAGEWPESARARAVKYQLGSIDWMWEREWRVPGRGGLGFASGDVVNLIVPRDAMRELTLGTSALPPTLTRWLQRIDSDPHRHVWVWPPEPRTMVRKAS